jgi:Flp pilus assembly protein TadG
VSRLRSERGFLTLWLLGLCLLLLGLGGVSVDLWRVFSERQALSGLVDAAALAGASGIDPVAARQGIVRLDPTDASNRATASAAAQPDAGSLVSSSLNIEISPDGSEITVSANGQVHLTLLGLLAGGAPIAFHVSSTAAAQRSQ